MSATLDSDDPTRFRIGAGNGALVNDAGAGGPFKSKGAFGDAHVHLECMLPQGGDSGVYLQGRYEVQLADISARDAKACGGVYPGDGFAGAAPKELAYTGPGEIYQAGTVAVSLVPDRMFLKFGDDRRTCFPKG